jgi:GDP-L-fucose synthase
MDRSARVFVAGHRGMVGSAIVRRLTQLGYRHIITAGREELDLLDQRAVRAFFAANAIDQVFIAAARVGGIHANNTYPAEFLYENLVIENNLIRTAHEYDVQRLLFLGSSCIYPKHAAQPIREGALLTGPLEPTNEPYAIAKIAGIKLCESHNRQYERDYRSIMPCNLYGPGDNFHPENSHVIPALIRRFHEAVQIGASDVKIWGSGSPMREFLHVDDMAAASVHIMELTRSSYRNHTEPTCSHINVGSGVEISIRELAAAISQIAGFSGRTIWDPSKPDGTPRKLMDVSRLAGLGWHHRISLLDGLKQTYAWYSGAVPHGAPH